MLQLHALTSDRDQVVDHDHDNASLHAQSRHRSRQGQPRIVPCVAPARLGPHLTTVSLSPAQGDPGTGELSDAVWLDKPGRRKIPRKTIGAIYGGEGGILIHVCRHPFTCVGDDFSQ